MLGYWESAKINFFSKEHNKWLKINYKEERCLLIKSVGASARHVHTIKPGKMIPHSDKPTRHIVPSEKIPEYSFYMDLFDFKWPENLEHEIEIIVTQTLGHDGSERFNAFKGTLSSGSVKLDNIPKGEREYRNYD